MSLIIPIRKNGQRVTRHWWNILRDRLISNVGSQTIGETSFSIANNQASPADITDLNFEGTTVLFSVIHFDIIRGTDTASSEVRQGGRLGVYYSSENSEWRMLGQVNYGPHDAGVTFSITSAGQIQYTSTNIAGSNYDGRINFRANVFQSGGEVVEAGNPFEGVSDDYAIDLNPYTSFPYGVYSGGADFLLGDEGGLTIFWRQWEALGTAGIVRDIINSISFSEIVANRSGVRVLRLFTGGKPELWVILNIPSGRSYQRRFDLSGFFTASPTQTWGPYDYFLTYEGGPTTIANDAFKLYVNGTEAPQSGTVPNSIIGPMTAWNMDLHVGWGLIGSNYGIGGQIDSLACIPSVLTSEEMAEIVALNGGPLNFAHKNPVMWFEGVGGGTTALANLGSDGGSMTFTNSASDEARET